MLSKHGTLESAIMCVLWDLERNSEFSNTVKDVHSILAQNDGEKRAYTTVKTVMDRLVEKNMLLRFKQGKKFIYRTTYSNSEIIVNSLNEIANRYCNGDIEILSHVINTMNSANNPDKELVNA